MLVYVVCIVVVLLCVFAQYREAKNDELKMSKFKSDMTFAIISIVVIFGMFVGCMKCGSDDDSRRRIDRGYTSDPDYKPTFDSRGKYHNNGTGDRQIQYQGSREQQRDLDAIDKYASEHPDF